MENIAIERIKPNDYNPNEMTEDEFNECKAEVQHLGKIPKPIIVRPLNGKFVIVDGEHNWRAARDLGFTELPCEVMELDDLEAMRQTYKRNMHGTFNPVKLGQMFKRAIEKSGLSQRELAKQYEVSDGTVRNALMYYEAKGLRNSYAFEKLSVRQVRLYFNLPPIVRDKWLDAGADSRIVVASSELRRWEDRTGKSFKDTDWEDFEKSVKQITFDNAASYLNRWNEIAEAGLAEYIKPTKQEFHSSGDRIYEFMAWEHWNFCHRDKEFKVLIRPYTLLMIDYFLEPKIEKQWLKTLQIGFQHVYKLIYYDKQFPCTPDEVRQIFQESKSYGLDGGRTYEYPQFEYIHNALQLKLISKGIINAPIDLDKLPNPAEELEKIEIECKAPDYIKQADIPLKAKFVIYDFNIDPQIVPAARLEKAKRETVTALQKEYSQAKAKSAEMDAKLAQMGIHETRNGEIYFNSSPGSIQDLIRQRIRVIADKEKTAILTREQLAVQIMSGTKLYKTEFEKGLKLVFYQNLLKLTSDELKAIYYVMDYSYFLKRIKVQTKVR